MFTLFKRPLFALFSLLCLAGSSRAQAADVATANKDNLAFGKPATQSSTGATAVAALAVDGNIDGNLMKGSVTHTLDTNQPWWQVDLKGLFLIGSVTVHNRTDCCEERLSNFKLLVSEDNVSWQEYPFPGVAPEGVIFPVNRKGRYVKVQLNGQGILSLAEVVVTKQSNLAEGSPATQSSTGETAVAALAVDGKADGNLMKGSVTHTLDTDQPWWQVELLAPAAIGSVILHNRTDCCGERLSNFKVMVSDNGTTWQEYPYPGTAPQQVEIPVNSRGKYVRVQLNGKGILSLAEVIVTAANKPQADKSITASLIDPPDTLAEFQAMLNRQETLARAAEWQARLDANRAAIAAEEAKPTELVAPANVLLARQLWAWWVRVKNPQGTEFLRLVDSKGTQVASCKRNEERGDPPSVGQCSMQVPKLGTYTLQLVRKDLTKLAETGPITVGMPGPGDFSFILSCFLLESQGNFLKARCRVPSSSSSVIGGTLFFAGHGTKDSTIADYTQCLDVSNNNGKLVCNKEYRGVTVP